MGPRIVLVSREFPPDHGGGIGAYAARIAPALAEAGASVDVITRRLRSGETEPDPVRGVTVHRVEMGDRSGESCLRASIVVGQKLCELMKRGGIDAIEFAEYEAMGSAWLTLRSLDERAARVPVAVHLHSPTVLNAELNGHDPASLDQGMLELIEAERRCIGLADGVCAPGGFMADWARERFGLEDRPTVIPYAMDPAIDRAGEEADRAICEMASPMLLYAGRLEQRKGVDTLIRAWNMVAPRFEHWLLHLAGADTNTAPGGGSCRAWLESLLDPALRRRVFFDGDLGPQAMAANRGITSLAVIPSRWENFPNTCIEAMACRAPVVASDHGGMAEMLGLRAMEGAADAESGSVFPAGDADALAAALSRWMAMEPEERIRAGRAGRERILGLCDPQRIASQRIGWLGLLRAQPAGIDPALKGVLRVGEIEAGATLEDALTRSLDRFDRATGADARVDDPQLWAARMRDALKDCGRRGLSPVALYGAGHFTAGIGAALRDAPVEIACIIDDNPAAHGRTLHGLEIVSQAEAVRRGVRAAVLSANQWEQRLWESATVLREAGVQVVRLFSRPGSRRPRVMVIESGDGTGHFAGVSDELRARGVEVVGDTPHAVYPVPDDDLDLVCVADVLSPRSIAILRKARIRGIRTLLMMDGIVEWRNTFANPLAGPDFLRPAPVDFVCCATKSDEQHLRELGNAAFATGLPRLDELPRVERDATGPLMVATANTPWFSERERELLTRALRELQRVAADSDIPVRWRLTCGLDRVLGVVNHPGSLAEAMSGCSGVLSTPSTLLLEAALAGLPEASIEAFGEQPWSTQAIWCWIPEGEEDEFSETVELGHVLDLFSSPLRDGVTPEDRMRRIYPPRAAGRPARELVAERIAEIVSKPGRTKASAPLLDTVKLPVERPRGDRRCAVSVIVCDGSPTSGVTSFSLRMSAESAARDAGWEWRTLLVQTRPKNAANDGLRELTPEKLEHVQVCVLDPTADHHELIRSCREAVERLAPDVVVPNYSDLAWAVAAQLRHRGVRTLGIMHSDDDAYRNTLRERPVWDGGVAVSAQCAVQMRVIAAEVFESPPPVVQITYGVPVATHAPEQRRPGPLRLVYVGRLVEHQKRVSRLVELAEHLRVMGCDFALDVIGDGPDEESLRSAIEEKRLGDRVRLLGRRTPVEVGAQLEAADALVLVSDFEGTSVAMLEAMGRGVVPCVSRVASGVDEWVRDGENGVTARVGDVRGMAEKIVRLGRDRSLLEKMRLAAWETVRGRGSIGEMFEGYAKLLDAMMQRPLAAERDALGLHLTEGGRWLKSWCDDPESAERWARSVLEEAGYRSIARGRPRPGCDAVLVDTDLGSVGACEVDEWRAAGLGVGFVPLVICPGWVRLGAVIRRAMDAGSQRVALYGAGLHTRRALPLLREHMPIVGVIDDQQRGEMCGLPVVGPDEAVQSLGCDAAVLSSDTVEDRLWAASEVLRSSGVPVYPVYGAYDDSVGLASSRSASV